MSKVQLLDALGYTSGTGGDGWELGLRLAKYQFTVCNALTNNQVPQSFSWLALPCFWFCRNGCIICPHWSCFIYVKRVLRTSDLKALFAHTLIWLFFNGAIISFFVLTLGSHFAACYFRAAHACTTFRIARSHWIPRPFVLKMDQKNNSKWLGL